MVSGLATALNQFAPHVVVPKMIAAITPKAPVENGGDAVTEGAGMGGIRERAATRNNSVSELEARLQADKEASLASGYSVTGSTLFF